MAKKRFLLIWTQSPSQNREGEEGLDFMLALSALEQRVSLLFIGDGLEHLLKNQDLSLAGRRPYTDTFKAYAWYDIEHCYIAETALIERAIELKDLNIPVEVLDRGAIQAQISQHDCIFNF